MRKCFALLSVLFILVCAGAGCQKIVPDEVGLDEPSTVAGGTVSDASKPAESVVTIPSTSESTNLLVNVPSTPKPIESVATIVPESTKSDVIVPIHPEPAEPSKDGLIMAAFVLDGYPIYHYIFADEEITSDALLAGPFREGVAVVDGEVYLSLSGRILELYHAKVERQSSGEEGVFSIVSATTGEIFL